MIKKFWEWFWGTKQEPAATTKPDRLKALTRAIEVARASAKPDKTYNYPIKPPELPKGVVPDGQKPLLASDSAFASSSYANYGYGVERVGFPGYPYLAMLSTRAEYRMFAQSIATELTREWIVLNSTDTAGEETRAKITELTQAVKDIKLQSVIRLAAEHDSYYGRGQILLNLEGQDLSLPLAISDKTIKKDTKFTISAVEAMWTTPNSYNAIDPSKPDFYKPNKWWMLGKEVHATRLLTIITRPITDILKPAFNFGGMSMSQLAEPYVDNWLRTRQSVSDLISNFSITALQTSMEEVLTSDDPGVGAELFKRAELFTLTRDNKGLMLLDKTKEDLVQVNTPLSGLSELQAQSQEQMCSVSHTSAVKLLGIAPSGFGNVAEGEIRSDNDWIAAQQEAYWREPIETIINILQIIKYGKIDPDIVVAFEPLYQMTPKELAEIRTADSQTDSNYVNSGVVDPIEVREKIARDPESGYQGLDLGKIPDGGEDPDEDEGEERENEDVS